MGALEWLAEEIGAPATGAAADVLRAVLPVGEPLTPAAIARTAAALAPEGTASPRKAFRERRNVAAPRARGAARSSSCYGWIDRPRTAGGVGRRARLSGSEGGGAQADGSAMYTLQSLWTMARERLDVTSSSSRTGGTGFSISRCEEPGPAQSGRGPAR